MLHRCLARLEAATTRSTTAFDASRVWEADGARRPEPLSPWWWDETFAGRVCELANGAVVSPGSLVDWRTRPGWSGWSSTGPTG